MPSITDELMGKTSDGAKKTAKESFKVMKEVRPVKGICLLLMNATEFTTDAVMRAVHDAAFKRTGDIKYSDNNIDISNLKKSGRVYPIEENILQDAMKYFDKHCKECGVKYSAMKDTRGEGKPDYKPSYMVFFEGKDTDLILHVLKEAYKDYAEEKQNDKQAEKSGRKNEQEKNQSGEKQEKENQEKPEKRESVKAKLAFFRDRVAARDKERDAVEKHHQHDDIQR